MGWLRSHLTIVLPLVAGTLIVGGVLVLIQRAPERPQGIQAWGGSSDALQDPQAYTPNPVLSSSEPSYGSSSPTFLPIAPSQQPGTDTSMSNNDLASLLTLLSASSHLVVGSAPSTTTASIAYQYIPSGLIATTTFSQKRTPTQQVLYEYGNEIGSYIQSYEARAGNIPQILKDQIEDRGNPQKGKAVKDIGAALIYIGTQMKAMEQVPAGTEGLHTALAASYQEIGSKLQAIPDAQGDQAFIAAIQSYNTAADTFAKNFVALADFFGLSQVKFSSVDPGNVFTFSAGGSF